MFYLGLGTGITAGTALHYPVDEVIISEIAPSAIQASKEFFEDHTNGLYEDPRVTVIAEDGRNVLRGSNQTYDLIISDLFIPWKAGTGTLYSIEHYTKSLERLNSGGMYAQWLPLYQLTQDEFAIIARSMTEVFPTVSLWRGNFYGHKAVVALVGHQNDFSLKNRSSIFSHSKFALLDQLNGQGDRVPFLSHFAGVLKRSDARIITAPINTDNTPIIEYLAPINHRLEKAGKKEWFTGQHMLEFIGSKLNNETLSVEPHLSGIDQAWYDVIKAGYYLQAYYVLKDQGHKDQLAAKETYHSLVKKAAKSLH